MGLSGYDTLHEIDYQEQMLSCKHDSTCIVWLLVGTERQAML